MSESPNHTDSLVLTISPRPRQLANLRHGLVVDFKATVRPNFDRASIC